MKPLDVLAVMDELIDFEERHAEYEPRANYEARDARAAVADVLNALCVAIHDLESSDPSNPLLSNMRRAAVMAGVTP